MGDTEAILAEVLSSVVSAEQVSPDSHFFDDLGANSLLMAQFCARVRKRGELPSVSMKDIYQNPTIRRLAAALAGAAAPAASPAASPTGQTVPVLAAPPVSAPMPSRVSGRTRAYVLCGAAQLLVFLGYSGFAGFLVGRGYQWIDAGSGLVEVYLRSVCFGGIGFVLLCTLPVVAKWILIGRWRSGEFPVWGLAYLRFWTVKALIHANPMILFVGNPLYVIYLRALGARIGRGVTILSPHVPVCTDLLTVGAGTVIRKDSLFQCYRAHAGRIQTGPVTLGQDVYIGEKTVLDIHTSMGDGAQLGHTSALQRGDSVPRDQRWHGSPAQRTSLNYLRVTPAPCGRFRRAAYGLASLLRVLFLTIPMIVGGMAMLIAVAPGVRELLEPGAAMTSWAFLLDALVLSGVLYFGAVVGGLLVVFTVPRLLNQLIKPDRVYPLYGFHYSLHRAIIRMTNIKFYKKLFGDSSYIVGYLRLLGYELTRAEQTGSNFGSELQHESPYLSTVGRGTMACDGLSLMNADYSSTSFRVARVSIGARNFLGNNLAFPAGARTGDNVLLATKAMVPLDGEVREGVGLLGSPSFEIPRSVERDGQFDHYWTRREQRVRLAAKDRYNRHTLGVFLFTAWSHFFVLTLISLAAVDLYALLGPIAPGADMALSLMFSVFFVALAERVFGRFRRLRPQFCSIYDRTYWFQERLWKVPDDRIMILNGTPFKNMIWRLMGVRLGRRVFDDGCYLTERTLATLGDDCTLNAGSKIQCHSLEDGTFKSDHTTVGAGCTLGVGAFVHYGVTLGDGAVLAADSFLMKGEEVPPHARWVGNPAHALTDHQQVCRSAPPPVSTFEKAMAGPVAHRGQPRR